MTKKDYIRIATALQRAKPTTAVPCQECHLAAWARAVKSVARALNEENPERFDWERFVAACGLEE